MQRYNDENKTIDMEKYKKLCILTRRMIMANYYLEEILDEVIAIAQDVVDTKCDVLGTHNQQLLIVEKKGVNRNDTRAKIDRFIKE